MTRNYEIPIAASLLLGLLACGSEGGKTNSESSEAKATQECKASLKECGYDESETACSSLQTPVIPLMAGGQWGDLKVEQGPYGSYTEWNEGEAFAIPENFLEISCNLAASAFGEPASVTADVLDLRGAKLTHYTVFRPACMKDGETYPVITWGNGTCGQSGGYATLLATLASHGFVVIAANSRWVGSGNEQLKALDFAKAANEDPDHVLYQKLDLEKIGAMGHSQGAMGTAAAAKDPRVKAIILWNGGAGTTDKPFLAVSGERDIGNPTVESLSGQVTSATVPAAWLYYHKVLVTGGTVTGHLTLMEQPERVTDVTVAWWKYILSDDPEAKKMFVGDDCGLCGSPDEYEFGQKNLK